MRGTARSQTAKPREAPLPDPRIVEARFARSGGAPVLLVRLKDARILALPLWMYPTLVTAKDAQRKRMRIIAGGRGLNWPDLDLDLSARGMLDGRPDFTRAARETATQLQLKDYSRLLAWWSSSRRAG